MLKIDPEFWEKVESNNKFVIYGDTDSLYVYIPEKFKDSTQALEIIKKNYSDVLNNLLKNILEQIILPKMNIPINYNKTDFKTETVIDSILLMDAKKQYAYRYIAKDDVVFEKPKIEYVGLPIKKVNFSKISKEILKTLIDDIALEKKLDLSEAMGEIYSKLKDAIENLDIEYFGNPVKWKFKNDYKSTTDVLIGMKFYNTIFDRTIFRPGVSGYKFPILFTDSNHVNNMIESNRFKNEFYLGNITIDKVTFIVVPYNYVKEELREKLNQFKIQIPIDVIWSKSIGTIGKNIIEIINKN